MNVLELVDKVGGEIVRGTARLRVGGEYVTLATHNGSTMVFTEAGREMVSKLTAKPAPRRKPSKTTPTEVAADPIEE